MSAQHTAAPWYWSDNVPDAPKNYCTIVDADGFTIAEPSPMGEADARLIAAAPDLLIALRDLLEDAVALGICESNMSGSAVAARAAIARATGGAA